MPIIKKKIEKKEDEKIKKKLIEYSDSD